MSLQMSDSSDVLLKPSRVEILGFFGQRISVLLPTPLTNSAMMRTLTAHCQWEDVTVQERTGHSSSYAEAKKVKVLALHTHGSPRASVRD